MADLLSHVLVAYALLTVASWGIEAITPPWIAVGMAGAAIPDLVKIDDVLDSAVIESRTGVAFSWDPFGTLAGVLLVAAAIALAFDRRYRRRAYAFLLVGGLSALALDGLRAYADGRAGFWLYPLWWRPPTPSLYVSSDPRVLAVAVIAAGAVALADRYVVES